MANNPIDRQVGANVRRRREELGLPQKDLAKALGISFQQVQKYESGANRISASRMWELCEIFGCEPNDLFAGVSSRRNGRASQEPKNEMNARQVLDLNRSFGQIGSHRTRRSIVQLVKAVGGNETAAQV